MNKWSYLIEADEERRRRERRRAAGEPVSQHQLDREALRYEGRRWEKATIRLSMLSSEVVERQVNGEILRPLNNWGVSRSASGNGYTLTHIPTGMRVCDAFRGKGSKKTAKDFGAELESLALDSGTTWLIGRFRENTSISGSQLDVLAKLVVMAARNLNLADEITSTAFARCKANKLLPPEKDQ